MALDHLIPTGTCGLPITCTQHHYHSVNIIYIYYSLYIYIKVLYIHPENLVKSCDIVIKPFWVSYFPSLTAWPRLRISLSLAEVFPMTHQICSEFLWPQMAGIGPNFLIRSDQIWLDPSLTQFWADSEQNPTISEQNPIRIELFQAVN